MDPYTVDQINEYLAQGSLLPTDNEGHIFDFLKDVAGHGQETYAPPPRLLKD